MSYCKGHGKGSGRERKEQRKGNESEKGDWHP